MSKRGIALINDQVHKICANMDTLRTTGSKLINKHINYLILSLSKNTHVFTILKQFID